MSRWGDPDARIREVAAKFPKVGHLTGDDLDDEAAGALIRALIQSELKDEFYTFSAPRRGNRDGCSAAVGVGWGDRVTNQQILDGYERWSTMLRKAS